MEFMTGITRRLVDMLSEIELTLSVPIAVVISIGVVWAWLATRDGKTDRT